MKYKITKTIRSIAETIDIVEADSMDEAMELANALESPKHFIETKPECEAREIVE